MEDDSPNRHMPTDLIVILADTDWMTAEIEILPEKSFYDKGFPQNSSPREGNKS